MIAMSAVEWLPSGIVVYGREIVLNLSELPYAYRWFSLLSCYRLVVEAIR